MIVFDLLINGELVSSAGAEDLSVLSHTVTARGKLGPASQGTSDVKDTSILEVSLTGLSSSADEPRHVHLQWHHAQANVGDEITIRIVERPTPGIPLVVQRTDEA